MSDIESTIVFFRLLSVRLGQIVQIPTAVLERQEGVTRIEKLLHSSTDSIFPVVDSYGQLISNFICQTQKETSCGLGI